MAWTVVRRKSRIYDTSFLFVCFSSFDLAPAATAGLTSSTPQSFQYPTRPVSQMQPSPTRLTAQVLVRLDGCARSRSTNLQPTQPPSDDHGTTSHSQSQATQPRQAEEKASDRSRAHLLGRQVWRDVDVPRVQDRASGSARAQAERHRRGERSVIKNNLSEKIIQAPDCLVCTSHE